MHGDDTENTERLDRISTHWTMVFEAHQGNQSDAMQARCDVLLRYRKAVFRYALALTRDPDAAEELSQDFAIAILSGSFHRADPSRGRFRDYLRTALVNAARKIQREKSNSPEQLLEDVASTVDPAAENNCEPSFAGLWREEILNQTWLAMQQQRPVYHDLLRLRVDHPDSTSAEIARRYEQEHDRRLTAVNVRKTVSRAQARFAELLVREVTSILDSPEREDVRNELLELDLLKYCRSALEKWQPG